MHVNACFALLHWVVFGQQGALPTPQLWEVIRERSIGAGESGPLFTRIVDATANSRGEVSVLDGNEPYIRVFTRDGRVRQEFGRAGSGPGEFRQPQALGWRSDSLWVRDAALRRATLLDRQGRVLRTFTAPLGQALAMASDGRVLVGTNEQVGTTGFGSVTRLAVLRFTWEGDLSDTVVVFERHHQGMRVPVLVNGTRGALQVDQPFNDDPLFQVAKDGSSVVLVNRRADNPISHSFTLTKLTTKGDTVFSRRFPYRPLPLDHQTFRMKIEQIVSLPVSPSLNLIINEKDVGEMAYRPKNLPAVEGVMVASDGNIWLQRETVARSQSVEHLVLGPDGIPIGEARIPRGERVVDAYGSTVWTTSTSPDGAPLLSWYRIIKP